MKTVVCPLLLSLTAFFTANFALHRYKSEKWWDRKAQCYFETVAALNKIIEVCDVRHEAIQSGLALTTPEKLEEKYEEGKFFFITQTNIGRLLLSENAYEVLLTFDQELSSIEDEPSGQIRTAGIRVAAEKCVDALIPLARKDLGANRFGSL